MTFGVAVALAAGCALPADKVPPPPGAHAGAQPGGRLTVGVTPPAGVDPLSFHEPASVLIGSALCDTLVTVDPETGHLKPGLAKKWTVTEEGARVIFQLRRDAYFHDGRQVRSADVVESLERLASPENASYMAQVMDAVAGIERFRSDVEEGLPQPSLHGARVIEPFSFELFLRPANPDFLRALAHPATAPVSKAPYDEDADVAPSHPRCAGPYSLESPYTPGDAAVVLKRFDRYYAQNTSYTAGGKGYVDELHFRIYPDEDAAFQAFERGEVDVAHVPTARVAEARARLGPRVATGDLPHVEFVGLPHGDQSPFARPDVRRALSLALDREAIVKEVYGDAHVPADGFVPPALAVAPYPRRGKGTSAPSPRGCDGGLRPAADDARRLWAESSKEVSSPVAVQGGGPLKLYFNDESTNRRLAEAVARQWREVLGVEVEVVPSSWDAFVQRGTTGAGFDGAFRISHAPLYPSAQAFLGTLFRGATANGANLGRYTNGDFEAAYTEDLRPVVEGPDRALRTHELERLLCDDMPSIPIAFGRRSVAVSDRVVAARASQRLLDRHGVLVVRELAVAG